MGEVQARGFIGKIEVQFTAVVARRETMPSEWNATQNTRIHVHVEPTRDQRVMVSSREGNRDTLKVNGLLKPRNAQLVTSLMLRKCETSIAKPQHWSPREQERKRSK